MENNYDIHLENIFDRKILKTSIIFIAVYTIIFEELRSLILNVPLRFFADNIELLHDDYKITESVDYKTNVLALSKNDRLITSLCWFKNMGALSETEVETLLEARRKRGDFVHRTINEILKGIVPKGGGKEFFQILEIYFKLDNWCINNAENHIPHICKEDQIDSDNNFSIRAHFVKAIVDILFLDEDETHRALNKK